MLSLTCYGSVPFCQFKSESKISLLLQVNWPIMYMALSVEGIDNEMRFNVMDCIHVMSRGNSTLFATLELNIFKDICLGRVDGTTVCRCLGNWIVSACMKK